MSHHHKTPGKYKNNIELSYVAESLKSDFGIFASKYIKKDTIIYNDKINMIDKNTLTKILKEVKYEKNEMEIFHYEETKLLVNFEKTKLGFLNSDNNEFNLIYKLDEEGNFSLTSTKDINENEEFLTSDKTFRRN